jgi:hypothetical protein
MEDQRMRMKHLLASSLLCLVAVAMMTPPQSAAKPLNIPIVYYKLPNGLRVVISEDHTAPVVTVGVYYHDVPGLC